MENDKKFQTFTSQFGDERAYKMAVETFMKNNIC
jgi:hypothetical protein